MTRLTRAKAAAQKSTDSLPIAEDFTAALMDKEAAMTPDRETRAPLGDVAPNSVGTDGSGVGEKRDSGEAQELKKSKKGRKVAGKGGRKGEKEEDGEVLGEEGEEACDGSDSAQATTKKPGTAAADISATSIAAYDNTATPSAAGQDSVDGHSPSSMHVPNSPMLTATPKVIASLRKDTAGVRSTSNKENIEPLSPPAMQTPTRPTSSHRRVSTYDALEAAVVQAVTADVRSPQASLHQLPVDDAPAIEMNEAGSATVQLAEAVEGSKDAAEQAVAEVPTAIEEIQKPKPKTKKPAPVVRATKASQARISLAHPDKSVKRTSSPVSRPRASTTQTSFRHSMLAQSAPLGKRVSSLNKSTSTGAEVPEKKETVIPHSKPRPVSISFPTPPPPPKSKKPPTTSTFQLPGEAVAAKLKAAREERMRKEVEEAKEKKPAFKARPVPASLKRAPSIAQTQTSKARESLMNGSTTAPAAAKPPHKRTTSAITTKPTPPAQDLRITKRPATSLANITKPRPTLTQSTTSTNATTTTTVTITTQRLPSASKGTVKGKEVFNRAALAKEAAEREKREKEEAAKKARAEAAERGRQASREWAERQRGKRLGSGKMVEGQGAA